jgi:hypothetical protein
MTTNPNSNPNLNPKSKDAKSLEHSLSLFVEGEQIADYQWDDNGPRLVSGLGSELGLVLSSVLKAFTKTNPNPNPIPTPIPKQRCPNSNPNPNIGSQ